MTESDLPGFRAKLRKDQQDKVNAEVDSATDEARRITTVAKEYAAFRDSEAVKLFQVAAGVLYDAGRVPHLVISKSKSELKPYEQREGEYEVILAWDTEGHDAGVDRDDMPRTNYSWVQARLFQRRNSQGKIDGYILEGRETIEAGLKDEKLASLVDRTVSNPRFRRDTMYVEPYSLAFGTNSHLTELPFPGYDSIEVDDEDEEDFVGDLGLEE